MKKKPVCHYCGSESVTRDANAEWDVESQDWVLSGTYDDCYCHDCDDRTKLDWVDADQDKTPAQAECPPGSVLSSHAQEAQP